MLVFAALLVDGLQGLLTLLLIGVVINPFISVMAGIMFWLWFRHLGVKMGIGAAATAIAEFIPVMGSFPVWTGYVLGRIAIAKGKNLLDSATGS